MSLVHEYLAHARKHVNERFRGMDPFDVMVQTVFTILALYTIYHLMNNKTTLKKRFINTLFSTLKKVPAVQAKIESEKAKALVTIRASLNPPSNEVKYLEIPEKGVPRDMVLAKMKEYKTKDDPLWAKGKVSGCVYLGDTQHTEFINAAYSMFSTSNPLHPEVFPSVKKFEAEVIRMTASMLHGDKDVCGAMTSGGTESIIMAVKAYKEFAKSRTSNPELVVPVTAHAAFDKACEYFGIKLIHIPLDKNMLVDINLMRKAINRNTIAIVGSAPNFPHGMIDPIPELAKLAKQHKIGLHVDACLGGYILPFIKQLGYPIDNFDFAVDGVTSMSCDTHKYAFTPKGTSVVLFKNSKLRSGMYFVATEWPGGVYASPSIAGSRPGGLIAGAWASIVSVGKEGYMKYVDQVMVATHEMIDGIKKIEGLYIVGDPKAMVIAFGSNIMDIYKVNAAMSKLGWHLNALQKPSSLHICVTAKHVAMAPAFIADLKAAVAEVKASPDLYKGGSAAIYGMAATVPDRSIVKDLAQIVLDVILEP